VRGDSEPPGFIPAVWQQTAGKNPPNRRRIRKVCRTTNAERPSLADCTGNSQQTGRRTQKAVRAQTRRNFAFD
jgi:hypothetical protein